MFENGNYGGEVEIQAFVAMYNIYVEVHHSTFNNTRVFGDNSNNNQLILLLSGTIDSGHYDIINCLNTNYWNNREKITINYTMKKIKTQYYLKEK